MKLHKGDEVMIMVGKDRGKKGKIEKVFPQTDRVLLPGLNMFKRHMKKRDDQHPGGIMDFARPVKVSNVAVICPKCGKPTRIGYRLTKTDKERICKKCENTV